MGKKSAYNENLKKERSMKFKELRNELPSYVHSYLDSMVIDYQINTLIAYARDLKTFFEYLQEMNPSLNGTPLNQISEDILNALTQQDIVEYRNYLSSNDGLYEHSNQASSIERRMAPLRGFFADACDNGILSNNPTLVQHSHHRKRKEKKEIVFLENNEVTELLHVIESTAVASPKQQKFCQKTRLRDLAIISLLLNTGIRISECVGLDLDDINFKDNSLRVYRKGGFEETIFFNKTVACTLTDYIKNERIHFVPSSDEKALFLSSKKQRMAVRSIQAMVKKFSLEAVPGKKISCHKLRSTYGTILYEITGDIRLVADILGHSDISTTAKHYSALKKRHKQRGGEIEPFSNKKR